MGWANNSTFRQNAEKKSRKCAETLCVSAIQKMANKDEQMKRSRHGVTARS
jgi:hypothetical protein